jgi:hypothetical protein
MVKIKANCIFSRIFLFDTLGTSKKSKTVGNSCNFIYEFGSNGVNTKVLVNGKKSDEQSGESPLFRPEVLATHSSQWLGAIRLAQLVLRPALI